MIKLACFFKKSGKRDKMENQVKEVKIVKNILTYNEHHDVCFLCVKGVIIIEMKNGTKHILDIESNADITNSDYLKIIETNDMEEEILFKNVLYDEYWQRRLLGDC